MGRPKNTPEHFWANVDKSGECWIWTAGRDKNGYGKWRHECKSARAHRVSWLFAFGEIPLDKPHVLHRCDNPPCVNPAHLWVGTNADNVLDKMNKGRQLRGETHYFRLHPEKRPRGDSHPARLHPERMARGEGNGQSKLIGALVREIRSRWANGERQVDIAASVGVGQSCVSAVCRRQTWAHVD